MKPESQVKANEYESKLDALISEFNRIQRMSAEERENLPEGRLDEIEAETEQAIEDYNTTAKIDFYERCFDDEKPLLKAVILLEYDVVDVTDKKDKTYGTLTRTKAYKKNRVQLQKLAKYATDSKHVDIGENKDWLFMIEKLNQLMTAYAAKELGYKDTELTQVLDTYAMHEIARKLSLGETPTSKNQITANLQMVINGMIGEGNEERNFKAMSFDAAYLRMQYGKKSRVALTMATANTKLLCDIMVQICHRVVMGLDYKVSYKTAK